MPIYLSDCARLFGLDEWRPRRSAEQVLADIHEWIAADEERIAAGAEYRRPTGGKEQLNAMPVAIITGSGGLIGSEAVDHFIGRGLRRGRDRERHAGPLLRPRVLDLARHRAAGRAEHSEFRWENADIRDADGDRPDLREHAGKIELVVHTAAQPSHDWAASEPQTDFGVNANGTLNLLEAARAHCPDAPFVFCSTNKVYGDTPNRLPLEEPGEAAGAARGPPLLQGHRHLDVDRLLDPLAVRRLQGRRRPAGPGVRPLLRDADRRASAAAA